MRLELASAGTTVAELLVAPFLLVVGGFAALVVRRRLVARGGGVFECSLRSGPPRRAGKGWRLGYARCSGDDLQWYRVFSLAPRPARVLARGGLTPRARRRPRGSERFAVPADAVVLECSERGSPVALAVEERALNGLLAWLEAGPAGRSVDVA